MPFKSEKQRRFLWLNHPDIARKWTKKYGTTSKPEAEARRKAAKRELKRAS